MNPLLEHARITVALLLFFCAGLCLLLAFVYGRYRAARKREDKAEEKTFWVRLDVKQGECIIRDLEEAHSRRVKNVSTLLVGLKRYLKQYGQTIKEQGALLDGYQKSQAFTTELLKAIDFCAERGLRDTSTTSYKELRNIQSMILEHGIYPKEKA